MEIDTFLRRRVERWRHVFIMHVWIRPHVRWKLTGKKQHLPCATSFVLVLTSRGFTWVWTHRRRRLHVKGLLPRRLQTGASWSIAFNSLWIPVCHRSESRYHRFMDNRQHGGDVNAASQHEGLQPIDTLSEALWLNDLMNEWKRGFIWYFLSTSKIFSSNSRVEYKKLY